MSFIINQIHHNATSDFTDIHFKHQIGYRRDFTPIFNPKKCTAKSPINALYCLRAEKLAHLMGLLRNFITLGQKHLDQDNIYGREKKREALAQISNILEIKMNRNTLHNLRNLSYVCLVKRSNLKTASCEVADIGKLMQSTYADILMFAAECLEYSDAEIPEIQLYGIKVPQTMLTRLSQTSLFQEVA